MSTVDLVLVTVAATAAGWIDAVVGGGGLVLIPALLLGLPGAAPATALGTNKLAAVFGTAFAAFKLTRATDIDWRLTGITGLVAIIFAGCGALLASIVPAEYFRPIVMVLLLSVAIFVVLNKGFGTSTRTAKKITPRRFAAAIILAGVVIGLYDGILGPGTGTFLIMVFMLLLAQDFVTGATMAKVVNSGTNLGALVVFAFQGHVMWKLGILLAVFNVLGAYAGAHMAVKRGSRFIRVVLLVVVVGMLAKLSVDQFG